MALYDISVELRTDMVCWEDLPGPDVSRYRRLERGDSSNNTRVTLDLHTGTHVDAPYHFLADGTRVDQLDLEACCGPCYVAATDAPVLSAAVLDALRIPDTSRLLCKTANAGLYDRPGFATDYVAFDASGAEWIARRGIRLVGIDYLSVERYPDTACPVHRILLSHDVVLLEGLDLRGVAAGHYLLSALPVRIAGAEAAPVRAVLMDATN